MGSELLYIALVRLDAVNGLRPVLLFLGIMGALFALYALAFSLVRGEALLVWGGAILFRVTLLPAGLPPGDLTSRASDLMKDLKGQEVVYERFLLYDSDIWRFLWDGYVGARGVNPYLHPPSSPELDGLVANDPFWSDVRDRVNHPEIPTIYPPAAQALFRLSHGLAPGSVFMMKALFAALDLVAGAFLAATLRSIGRPASGAVLYLWNPLVVKVFSGSGHVDAALVALLAALVYFLIQRRRVLAAACWGLATLVKLSPLVLLPFVSKRLGGRGLALAAVVVSVGYATFAIEAGSHVFDGLRAFSREWQFNGGPYSLLSWALTPFVSDAALVARAVSALPILGILFFLTRLDLGREETFAHYAVLALAALVVLGPTVMPWYVTWLLPLAVVARQSVWLYFSGFVCAAFLVMIDETQRAWVLWLEYGALAVLFGLTFVRRGVE